MSGVLPRLYRLPTEELDIVLPGPSSIHDRLRQWIRCPRSLKPLTFLLEREKYENVPTKKQSVITNGLVWPWKIPWLRLKYAVHVVAHDYVMILDGDVPRCEKLVARAQRSLTRLRRGWPDWHCAQGSEVFQVFIFS